MDASVILDTLDRDRRKIHLDQGLLDRTLAPPVTLNDRRLERLRRSFVLSAAPRRPRCLRSQCRRVGIPALLLKGYDEPKSSLTQSAIYQTLRGGIKSISPSIEGLERKSNI